MLKNKEGETSLTACHCRRSSGAPHAGKNSTHLTAVHPKSLRCQQLRDTLASAPRSHPRGTLRGPGLHLHSCRARNPSQGPPAAHAALKSVPLAAAKTIREAASPRTNPGCVIVPHRRGSAATAPRGTRPRLSAPALPPLPQPGFRCERTKVSHCRGLGTAHGLSGSPRSLHGHVRRKPGGFSPPAQLRLPHGAQALLIFYHRIPLCP